MNDNPVGLTLTLGYAHGTGALAPYFGALREGRTLASRCRICAEVRFPPHISCPDDGGACDWVELDGEATVVAATAMRVRLPFANAAGRHVFVMAAMDGAGNTAFGRCAGAPGGGEFTGRRVRLVAAATSVASLMPAPLFELVEKG